jgi:hypothetical protein
MSASEAPAESQVAQSHKVDSVACAGCGAPLPTTARFCPGCGRPVDPDTGTTVRADVPPSETGPVPVAYAQAEPHWFGVTPPTLLLALAVAGVVVAIVLFATGHWPVGLILIGVSILLLVGFLEVARRKPDTAATRRSAEAFDGFRARTASTLEAFAARGRAGRESARVRMELARVHAYRRDLVAAFGDAVYRGADAEPFRAQLGTLDEYVRGLEAELERVVSATRKRIEMARLAVQETEMVAVPEPYPPPDEGTPPAPATIPEPAPPPDEGTPPQPDPVPTRGPVVPPD